MTAQPGRDLLLKIEDDNNTDTYLTIGGLRSRSISLNSHLVDVSHSESNGWRELLGGAGLSQASISGSGVFLNDDASKETHLTFLIGYCETGRLSCPILANSLGNFKFLIWTIPGPIRVS